MRFDEIARDLVHTASRLLRGRIVNIMDTSGVIVASTDAERIGTTHEGAREVVRTGRPVAIEKSDVPRYPGAREGYNLPVLSDNRLTSSGFTAIPRRFATAHIFCRPTRSSSSARRR